LKTWDESKITSEDLTANNPYNTRVVTGFPHTPICNPGLESINAARNPVNSTYYYFISDLTGVMHYARTAAEHNNNVNQYLR
ncbi:MAG: endolytic transglycosylase MltG, partial [Clostridiales bacterium]|nr:endolytic transglycosylase MltG [Clostridiales bacterium]